MIPVKIIGAGISGLLTAYYLAREGVDVEIFEIKDHPGGKIQTQTSPLGLMESAANAVIADARVEAVAHDIGLHLISTKREARKRYIFKNGRAQRWPLSLKSTWRLITFAWTLKRNPQRVKPQVGETLAAWAQRVMDAEVVRDVLNPFCQGIFGTTAPYLSASLFYNYFFNRKGITKGKLKGSIAPAEGMGQWSVSLVKYLRSQNAKIHYNWRPETLDKNPQEILVIATDLVAAVSLLEQWHDARARVLSQIPTVDLVSVNAFFKNQPLSGFGLLFPPEARIAPLGVLFNTSTFAGRSSEGVFSERWIFGGLSPSLWPKENDGYFRDTIIGVRDQLWKTAEAPLQMQVDRWPRALPLYGLELEKALADLPVESNNVYLMGNYLGDIGLNRIFRRAEELSKLILQKQRGLQ